MRGQDHVGPYHIGRGELYHVTKPCYVVTQQYERYYFLNYYVTLKINFTLIYCCHSFTHVAVTLVSFFFCPPPLAQFMCVYVYEHFPTIKAELSDAAHFSSSPLQSCAGDAKLATARNFCEFYFEYFFASIEDDLTCKQNVLAR